MNDPVVHVPMEAVNWPVSRDWKRLDQVTIGVWDCPHTTPEITAHGPYVVRSQDVRSGVFRYDEAAMVSEATYQKRIERAEPKAGDLLYSREGTYFGFAAEVPSGVRVCLGQRMVLIRPDPDMINSRFLRLWLNSHIISRHIHGFRDGSVAERLNMPTIRGLAVPEFERREQDDIAFLLGSLDDKIELNRQMNATLEEMARAIFKDWFVNFGPTRRKQDGATDPVTILGGLLPDPAKAEPVAALFPDGFGDEGLPEGWEERPFLSFLDIIGGGTPKTGIADYWDGDIPWFSVVDTPPKGGVFVWNTEKRITERGLTESSVRMIPVGTTIISARGTVGNIAMAAQPMTFNQSCYGLQAVAPVGDIFVYLATERMVERLKAMAHGSVFSTITRSTFESLNFAWADAEIFAAFEALIEPMFELVKANGQENQTLAATRDLLLPKLMSGEIRLKEAGDAL